MRTTNNQSEISKIYTDMELLEKKISDVAEGLNDVVTKSELCDLMNSFVTDGNRNWLIFNAKYSSADAAYESIFTGRQSHQYMLLIIILD